MAQTDLGKWMITNGGIYNPETAYEQLTIVLYNDSMFLTLKTVKGITPVNDNINYSLMSQAATTTLLSGIIATDTYGALGEVGAQVSSQALVDYLADSVMNKLITKTQIANDLITQDSEKVLSALQGYNLKQNVDELNSNLIRNEVVFTTGVYLTRSGNVRLVKFISAPANSDGLIVTMSNDKPNRRTFAIVESMDASGGSPVISRVDIRTDGAIYLTDLTGNALNKVALGEILYTIA